MAMRRLADGRTAGDWLKNHSAWANGHSLVHSLRPLGIRLENCRAAGHSAWLNGKKAIQLWMRAARARQGGDNYSRFAC